MAAHVWPLSLGLLLFLNRGTASGEVMWLPLAHSRGFVIGTDGLVVTEVYKPVKGRVRVVLTSPMPSILFESAAAGPHRLMAYGVFVKKQEEQTRYTMRDFRMDGVKVTLTRIPADTKAQRWVELGQFDLSTGCYELRSQEFSPASGITRIQIEPRREEGPSLMGDGAGSTDGEDAGTHTGAGEGDAFTSSPTGLPSVAEIETGPYLPRNLVRWKKLDVLARLDRVRWAVDVPTDDGANWVETRAEDLTALPTARALRVRLRVYPQGPKPPTVSGLRVALDRREEKTSSVAGRGFRVDFSERGEPIALWREDDRVGDLVHPNLFGLRVKEEGGQAVTLAAADFDVTNITRKPDGIALHFGHKGFAIETAVDIRCLGKGLSSWTITVKNGGARSIDLVRFPTFGPLTIQKSLHRPPRALIPESLWSAESQGSFPGNMSMGWSLWQGESSSVFLASLDSTFTETVFSLPLGQGVASVSATSQRVIPAGETFSVPYAVGLYQGDWYQAADWYRELSEGILKRPVHPSWAKFSDGWYLGSAEDLCYGRRSVTSFPDARWIGVTHCQTWYTGDGEFVGNFGYCSPRLGTPEQHQLDARRMAAHGGHFGYYIQDQEFVADHARSQTHIGNTRKQLFPAWTFFPTEKWYEDSSGRAPNGQPHSGPSSISSYSVTDQRQMCLGATGWREYLVRATRSNVEHYGCSTQYVDQLSCTTQHCWDSKHEHGIQYAAQGPNTVRVAREIVETSRKANPEFALAAEGMSCLTGQFVNLHLISSRPYRDHGATFLYTFSDALLFRGYANGCFQWTGGPLSRHIRSLYLFHRYDFCDFSPLMRDVMQLRQQVKDWMYDSRFMDAQGLTWEGQDCRAKWFLRQSSTAAGILINFETTRDGSAPVLGLRAPEFLSPEARALLYTEGGHPRPVEFKRQEDRIRFDLGPLPETVGSILVVENCPPTQALRPWACQTMTPGEDRLLIQVANVGTRSVSGKWVVESDKPVGLAVQEGAFTVDRGKVFDATIRIIGLAELRERIDVRVSFRLANPAAEYVCTAVVAPPLSNGNFEIDSNETGCPDFWWSRNNGIVHQVIRYSDDFQGYDLLAKLDDKRPAEGRKCLRLDGAVRYRRTRGDEARKHAAYVQANNITGDEANSYGVWPFSTSQMLLVKPSSAYRITYRWRSEGNQARGTASCPHTKEREIELRDLGGEGEWRVGEMTMRTPDVLPSYPLLTFTGHQSPGTARRIWIDDVCVQPLGAVSPAAP